MVELHQNLGSMAALINTWILESKPLANDSAFFQSTVLPALSISVVTAGSLHHLLLHAGEL